MNLVYLLFTLGALLLSVHSAYSTLLMLYGRENREKYRQKRVDGAFAPPRLSFSVLLPASHRAATIQHAIQRLVDLDYGDGLVQVLVIVESDDAETIAAVGEKLATLRRQGVGHVRLLTFRDPPFNKTHALNVGLRAATGDVITVFDDGNEPDPGILRLVNTVMLGDSVPVVECVIKSANHAGRWFAVLNLLDKFFQVKARLRYHGALGMAPLGGSALFIARQSLDALGGWDELWITEGADGGTRLRNSLAPVRIIDDEEFVIRKGMRSAEGWPVQGSRRQPGLAPEVFGGQWLRSPGWPQRLSMVYAQVLWLLDAAVMFYLLLSLWQLRSGNLPAPVAMIGILPAYMVLAQCAFVAAAIHEFAAARLADLSSLSLVRLLVSCRPHRWVLSNVVRVVPRWRPPRVRYPRPAGPVFSGPRVARQSGVAASPNKLTEGSNGLPYRQPTASRGGLAGAPVAPAGKERKSRLTVTALSLLLVASAMLWVVLNTLGYWIVVAAVLLGLAAVSQARADRRSLTVQLLAVLVTVSALDYFAWRAQVINWSAWYFSVPLFVAELFGALHTVGLQFTAWPMKERLLNLREDPTKLPIFVFIPTVNEGPAVLRSTIQGALAARTAYLRAYPHGSVTIAVCNDGRVANAPNWSEVESLAVRLGVLCVTRTQPGGAKAGNIEHAREMLDAHGDSLITIFDADQVAAPDFFLRTIPLLGDPDVGWVQTPQYYRNLGNPVANWANDQQQLFYRVLCPQKSAVNAAFICGTNVVVRAAALDEIGGLPQDSITEDFKASIELHPRWRGVFVNRVMATGLGPEDLRSYFKQQNRWASGTLQVLRTHWKSIFLPWHGDLQPGQRFQYFLACTHYLSGIRDLIYLVTPLVFLLTGIPTIRGSDFATYVSHFLPFYLASQMAFWYVAWGKTSPRGMIIGLGSFPVLVVSALTVVTGRRLRFAVTAKQRGAGQDYWQVLPHVLFVVGYVVALPIAWYSHRPHDTLLLSVAWTIYNTTLLGGMIWLSIGGHGIALPRVPRPVRVSYMGIRQLRPQLILGVAVPTAFALALFAFAIPTFSSPSVTAFDPGAEKGPPRIGVYLPVELPRGHRAALEQDLGSSFQIVSRTQDINDSFDTAWANRVRAGGARPGITLLFDKPGKPTYYSSLPAIANGVYDNALRRWAQAIRDYGHPVYITVLPQVDRNWMLTSAVANGGVPQDVPRAWQRVRSVFHAEGAVNVAWVWAPADPIHDQAYAPPVSSIDVVQFTMIGGYPGQKDPWPNAAPLLTQLAGRYPSIPLIIEVYASGTPQEKARWLSGVGVAVAAAADIHALVYHEGSPDPHATAAEDVPWSMASDPMSIAAMRGDIARLTDGSANPSRATVGEPRGSTTGAGGR